MSIIQASIETRSFQVRTLGSFPWDGKSVFDTMEEALLAIPPLQRFKGQKFLIREGEKPIEYWFVEDYRAGGWFDLGTPENPDWQELPEIIPQPVLYQPGGGELPPMSGETILASLDPNFPFKSLHILVQKELLYNGVSV